MTDDQTVTQADYDPDFVEAWTAQEDAGFIYSESNIAKVYLGWQMARAIGHVETPGRFAEYSNEGLAAQCRMQARENLDLDYSRFMTAVADRLTTNARHRTAYSGEVERLRAAMKQAEIHIDCASFRKAQDILLAALAQPEAGGDHAERDGEYLE